MISALGTGTLAIVASFLAGVRLLGLAPLEVLTLVAASMLAGFTTLFAVTRLESFRWTKANLVPNALAAWAWLVGIYFGLMLWLIPPSVTWTQYAWLCVPLIFCTGWVIVLFGPIQDLISRGKGRKTESKRPYEPPKGQ